MPRKNLNRTIAGLKAELGLIESKARGTSARQEIIWRYAESSKVAYLQHEIDKKISSEARSRGLSSILRDKKKARDSMFIAAGLGVLGGIVARDKYTALKAGMSGFDGALMGFGAAKWFISLGKKIKIAPEQKLVSGEDWIE